MPVIDAMHPPFMASIPRPNALEALGLMLLIDLNRLHGRMAVLMTSQQRECANESRMGDLEFFMKIALHSCCMLGFNGLNKKRRRASNPTRRLPP
jgi:hypothetical protein